MLHCVLLSPPAGQPPLLAPAQSPSPSPSAPASGGQIVTAIYPPSSSVSMATGVVSMTAVPPSVVYSVSSPSSASPHILSKHTAAATAPPTAAQLPQLHPERQELLLHQDRGTDRQPQTSSGSGGGSVAPPGGSAVSVRPCSPPLQIQTPGTG